MNHTYSSGAGNSSIPMKTTPYSVFSYDIFLTTKLVLNCVVKPVVAIVGVPSNVVSSLVFWRQGLRDRMNLCLYILALVDLCFLIVSVFFSIEYYLMSIDSATWERLDFKIQIYLVGVSHGFRIASGLIRMIIALDRCVCVLLPLKTASLMSVRKMGILLTVLIVLPQVAFIHKPFSYVLMRTGNLSDSQLQFMTTIFWKNNKIFLEILENVIMMIIVPMTTFIVVSLATVVTVVRLRAALAWRQKSSSNTHSGHTQQTAISKMLVFVSCIYILTTIPWVLLYLTELTLLEFSISGRFYVLYTSINSLVYYFPYVNSSVTIFVYYSRSSRFRRDVREMFSSCCSQRCTALVCDANTDVKRQ